MPREGSIRIGNRTVTYLEAGNPTVPSYSTTTVAAQAGLRPSYLIRMRRPTDCDSCARIGRASAGLILSRAAPTRAGPMNSCYWLTPWAHTNSR
jgi:hypothetical protein